MAANLDNAKYTQNGARQAIGVVVLDSNGDAQSSSNPAAVKAGDPAAVNVTIPNGAAISGAGAVHGALVGIITPAAFDATLTLSFQGGMTSGGTFYPIYDDAVLRSLANATIASGARFLALPLGSWLAFPFVKLVASGNVAADRVFTLVYAQ